MPITQRDSPPSISEKHRSIELGCFGKTCDFFVQGDRKNFRKSVKGKVRVCFIEVKEGLIELVFITRIDNICYFT